MKLSDKEIRQEKRRLAGSERKAARETFEANRELIKKAYYENRKKREKKLFSIANVEIKEVYIAIDGHHFFHNAKQDIHSHMDFFHSIFDEYMNFTSSLDLEDDMDAQDIYSKQFYISNRLKDKKIPIVNSLYSYIELFIAYLKEQLVEEVKIEYGSKSKEVMWPYDYNPITAKFADLWLNFGHWDSLNRKDQELYNLYIDHCDKKIQPINSENFYKKLSDDYLFCIELLETLFDKGLEKYQNKTLVVFNYKFSVHAAKPDYEDLTRRLKQKYLYDHRQDIKNWCNKNIELLKDKKLLTHFYKSNITDFAETESFYDLWVKLFNSKNTYSGMRFNLKNMGTIEETGVDVKMGIKCIKHILENTTDYICLITNDADHLSTIEELEEFPDTRIITCHLSNERMKNKKLKSDNIISLYPKSKMTIENFSWICFNDFIQIPDDQDISMLVKKFEDSIAKQLHNIEIAKSNMEKFKKYVNDLKTQRF